jgi:hypothetical protein
MISSVKALVFFAVLVVVGAAVGTSANAQNATSCPGGKDKNASDCLQIFQGGTQISLLAITEQDELDNPGKIWSIGGLVEGNPDRVGQWIALTEPGSTGISDVVGLSAAGVFSFVSDAADFSMFDIIKTVAETSSPLDITADLLSAADRANGFTAFFQSDVEGTVPEPSTWAMMLLGFAGLGFFGYRKARPTKALAA